MRQDDRFLMPRMRAGWWQWLVLLFIAPAVSASPLEPLQCAPEAPYRAPENFSEATLKEYCANALGRTQGPFRVWRARNGTLQMEGFFRDSVFDGVLRYYDEKGELAGEYLYARGARIWYRPAPFSLNRLIEEVNAQARANGENWTAYVLDRESLGFDYPISTPLAYFIRWIVFDESAARFKKTAMSNPKFCAGIRQMFDANSDSIRRIRMRWLDAYGKVVAEIWIRPDDCAAISPAD